MALATSVMFSSISDNYRTPRPTVRRLHEQYGFAVDLAATRKARIVPEYFGPDHETPEFRDALQVDWCGWATARDVRRCGFFNPPYSLCDEFVGKAAEERAKGFLSVGLLPVRSDTKWWHRDIWDRDKRRPRPGIGLDFIKGRLQFFLDVTDAMRQAVRRHEAGAIRPRTPDERKDLEKAISKAVGLPVLIVRAIIDNEEEAVAGAPFPSVVVSFHPEAK